MFYPAYRPACDGSVGFHTGMWFVGPADSAGLFICFARCRFRPAAEYDRMKRNCMFDYERFAVNMKKYLFSILYYCADDVSCLN